MNLVIDTGNTKTKMAVFSEQEMVAYSHFPGTGTSKIIQFCQANPLIDNAIISGVKAYPATTNEFLQSMFNTIILTHETPVPLRNLYTTPATLGLDRLAAAVAAKHLFPGENMLVIDAGTAITFDLITSDGAYRGGSIAPGIHMRYRALNTFTGKLPLLDYQGDTPLTGADTAASIQSGVLNGATAEVQGMIQQYQSAMPGIRILLTGGDYKYFEKQLKSKTFAAPNLVLEGLNLILRYNVEKH